MLSEFDKQRLRVQPRNEDIDREFLEIFAVFVNQTHQMQRLARKARDAGANARLFFELIDCYLGEAEEMLLKFLGNQSTPDREGVSIVDALLQKRVSSEGERFIWDFVDDNDADGAYELTEYENRVVRCDDIECQECIEHVKLDIAATDATKAAVRGVRTGEEFMHKFVDEFKKRFNPPTK